MVSLRRIPILIVAIAAALHWGSGGARAQTAVAPPVPCPILPFAPTGASGTIAPGETDCWRLDGAAGDVARVRVIKTAGANFGPNVEVLRPNGTTRCGPTTAREFTCQLDASGTHTILIRDYYGTNNGEYKLSTQRLNDPVGCGNLQYNTSGASGTIAPGETDCWRLDGAAGDVARVRVIKTAGANFGPNVEVLRPNGTTRCGPTTAREFTCQLDASGTHTILIRDYYGTNNGEYKLSTQRLNDPVGCGNLQYNTSGASGTIAPGETDCWRLDGAAGDVARVRVIKTAGANFGPNVEVLRPNGTTRCGPTTAREFTCQLDASGTHTILIRDYYGTNNGEYRIVIELVSSAAGLAFEGEAGSGHGQVMQRSAASGLKTVWLHAGESRQHAFSVAAAGRYHVAVWYSNDNFGPLELLTVTIDGAVVGQCRTQDTGDGGHGWNVFAKCDVGGVDLGSGAHALEVAVSGGDGYGVEIDLITLTI